MFKGRHFDQSIILLCVRWYLACGLSLRDLQETMAERGISVDHSTIRRWAVHSALLLLECFNRRKRAVTGKWHVDETYIKVRQSQYLNNRIEQDHRHIKRRVRPMLGFTSPISASITLSGIEMVHMMRKRQARYAFNPDPSLAEQFTILAT
jgi:transposase-like protein